MNIDKEKVKKILNILSTIFSRFFMVLGGVLFFLFLFMFISLSGLKREEKEIPQSAMLRINFNNEIVEYIPRDPIFKDIIGKGKITHVAFQDIQIYVTVFAELQGQRRLLL